MPSDEDRPGLTRSPSGARARRAFDAALDAARGVHAEEGGRAAAALLTRSVDAVIAELAGEAGEQLGRHAGVAFVAVGGYGRGELAPASDVDLLIAHKGWGHDELSELVRLVVYPLWDSGRQIGHRVRTIPETVRILNRADEAAAALDARLVAGDRTVFLELEAAVLERLQRTRAGFFRQLVDESHARRERFGHAGHLLEPDLRDSAGGLRDLQTLGWASRLLPGVGALDGLVSLGYLSEADRALVDEAHEFLFDLRTHLHVLTGRHQDRLYLADQDRVAHAAGFQDAERMAAGDRMMREVYRHARAVEAIVSEFWERLTHPIARRTGWTMRRFRPGESAERRFLRREQPASGDGWVVRSGRLEVVAVTPPHEDAAGWLRMFAHTIAASVPMGRGSVNRLQSLLGGNREPAARALNVPRPQVGWTPDARRELVRILDAGRAGVRVLQALDDAGLLRALIPEWETLYCCPQRDLYHRYTVDVHLFETVGELASSRTAGGADVDDAWSRVADPERLLVAGLLHDVGKGRGGDHTAIGSELARTIATRIGLGPDAVEDVAFLVREHLMLPDLAVRRDLNDERTATEAAVRAATAERLAMLFLLARADSLATGPEAWSAFREALVRELYAKAMRVVEQGADAIAGAGELGARRRAELVEATGWPPEEVDRAVDLLGLTWLRSVDPVGGARQLELMRTRPGPGEVRTAVRPRGAADELVVVAADRPGLFANVSGVLALRGVNVLRADIYTRADGVALEVFRVAAPHGEDGERRWESIRRDMTAALEGTLDLEDALSRKTREALLRRATAVAVPPRVVVDNRSSDFYTIVEVHAADRVGLLRTITKALTDAGCDLRLAKVATYGAQVVDVFYVRDLEGQKVVDDASIDHIERKVLEALAP